MKRYHRDEIKQEFAFDVVLGDAAQILLWLTDAFNLIVDEKLEDHIYKEESFEDDDDLVLASEKLFNPKSGNRKINIWGQEAQKSNPKFENGVYLALVTDHQQLRNRIWVK